MKTRLSSSISYFIYDKRERESGGGKENRICEWREIVGHTRLLVSLKKIQKSNIDVKNP